MDKIEKLVKQNLADAAESVDIDIDGIIAGTHRRIRKRANRRKVLYISPVFALLLAFIYLVNPAGEGNPALPGGEMMIAGWANAWTESSAGTVEEGTEQELMDQSIDYLIDDSFISYSSDVDELLDENDFEDFVSFLKEA